MQTKEEHQQWFMDMLEEVSDKLTTLTSVVTEKGPKAGEFRYEKEFREKVWSENEELGLCEPFAYCFVLLTPLDIQNVIIFCTEWANSVTESVRLHPVEENDYRFYIFGDLLGTAVYFQNKVIQKYDKAYQGDFKVMVPEEGLPDSISGEPYAKW